MVKKTNKLKNKRLKHEVKVFGILLIAIVALSLLKLLSLNITGYSAYGVLSVINESDNMTLPNEISDASDWVIENTTAEQQATINAIFQDSLPSPIALY